MIDRDYRNFTNQKQWEAYIKDVISHNRKAAERACLIVYHNQTDYERQQGTSFEENKVGFNREDSIRFSDIAKRLERGEQISIYDSNALLMKMPKYWKQVMWVAKENVRKEAERKAQEPEQLKLFEVC